MRHNYYDCEFDADKTSEHIALESKIESLQEFYSALYSELTSREPLDLDTIYTYMSEIAGYLDIDERQFGDLNISRESKILQFAGV